MISVITFFTPWLLFDFARVTDSRRLKIEIALFSGIRTLRTLDPFSGSRWEQSKILAGMSSTFLQSSLCCVGGMWRDRPSQSHSTKAIPFFIWTTLPRWYVPYGRSGPGITWSPIRKLKLLSFEITSYNWSFRLSLRPRSKINWLEIIRKIFSVKFSSELKKMKSLL